MADDGWERWRSGSQWQTRTITDFLCSATPGLQIPNVFAMPKGELVDSRVSLTQVRKAVEALHSHELKKKEKFEENQLLPAKEQNLWLNVTVKVIPSGHKLKPVKM